MLIGRAFLFSVSLVCYDPYRRTIKSEALTKLVENLQNGVLSHILRPNSCFSQQCLTNCQSRSVAGLNSKCIWSCHGICQLELLCRVLLTQPMRLKETALDAKLQNDRHFAFFGINNPKSGS